MVTVTIVLGLLLVLIIIRRIFLWKYYKMEIMESEIPSGAGEFSNLIIPHNGSTGITPGGVSWVQPQTRWGRR